MSSTLSAILTAGADSALAAAEAVAVKEAISRAIAIAENEIASAILSAANSHLDNFVSSLINPFINNAVRGLEGAVDSYAPQLLLQQAFSAERSVVAAEGQVAGRLHLSASELEACIERIYRSSEHLDVAERKLKGAIDELFSRPAPNAPYVSGLSPKMRMVLKGVVDTVKSDLLAALRTLIQEIVKHFVALLEDYKRALDDLNEQAAAIASKQHASGAPHVALLSAAGLGSSVAAGVAATSGLINAEQAEQVQVEAVAAKDPTAAMVLDSKPPVVSTEAASATTDVEEMAHVAVRSTVTTGAVTSSTTGVESVAPKHDAAAPHMSAAGGPSGPAATVSAHHDGGRQPTATGTASSQGASNASQLHAKHENGKQPRLGNADSSAHSVKEVSGDGKARSKPAVDATLTDDEMREG